MLDSPPATERQHLIVMLDPRDGALERALGVLRRRARTLLALHASLGEASTLATVTVTIVGTRPTAQLLAEHLNKVIGVRQTVVVTPEP